MFEHEITINDKKACFKLVCQGVLFHIRKPELVWERGRRCSTTTRRNIFKVMVRIDAYSREKKIVHVFVSSVSFLHYIAPK